MPLDRSGVIPPEEPVREPTGSGAPAEQVIGRWQAPEPANQDAFVEFTEYGLWFGSDGCNRADGAWRLDDDGAFTTLGGGGMTQIGCNNEPLPETVWAAKHAEIDAEGRLVLTDAEGQETVLLRTDEEPFTLEGRWVGPASTTALSLVEFEADGTWRGFMGCHEYSGTWELEGPGSQDIELPANDDGRSSFMTPHGLLRIASQSGFVAQCMDDAGGAMFPLKYSTDYWFGIGSTASFSLIEADPATVLAQQPVPFYRTERPELPAWR